MDAVAEPTTSTPMITTLKRKRGRPSKSDMVAQAQAGNNGALPKARKSRKKAIDGSRATTVLLEDSIIGQPVHGTLDGCFDAGYILTVRVGSTDTVLRGVVFGPGLSLPITKETDVAPNVKFAKREENVVLPMAYHSAVPPSAPVHPGWIATGGQSAQAVPVASATVLPEDAYTTAQYHVAPSLLSNEYTPVM